MSPFSTDPNVYGSLPTLGEALDRFDQGPGQTVLNTEIRALFERTDGAAHVFGIGLLHRHFDMNEDEILVEHGSTSTPWTVPQDPANFMGGHIVPRSWYFHPNKANLQAYEFGFERRSEGHGSVAGDPSDYTAFVDKLRDILDKHELSSTLGLTAVSPDYLQGPGADVVKCEKTFGRANVVFDVAANGLAEKDTRTAVWVFGRPNNSRQEAMLCFSGCICSPP